MRTLILREFEAALTDHDLLLTPTAPTVAFRLGEKMGDPYAMYLHDLFTIPVNIARHPAVSVPCGPPDRLPAGLGPPRSAPWPMPLGQGSRLRD